MTMVLRSSLSSACGRWGCVGAGGPTPETGPEATSVRGHARPALSSPGGGLPKPRPEHCARQGGILTGVTVSFFMAELYWRTDRRGSLLGKVSSGDLVAISQTPSYHSSGQSPARQGGLRRHLAQEGTETSLLPEWDRAPEGVRCSQKPKPQPHRGAAAPLAEGAHAARTLGLTLRCAPGGPYLSPPQRTPSAPSIARSPGRASAAAASAP